MALLGWTERPQCEHRESLSSSTRLRSASIRSASVRVNSRFSRADSIFTLKNIKLQFFKKDQIYKASKEESNNKLFKISERFRKVHFYVNSAAIKKFSHLECQITIKILQTEKFQITLKRKNLELIYKIETSKYMRRL